MQEEHAENQTDDAAEGQTSADPKAAREISSIQFPYGDQNAGVKICVSVQSIGGQSALAEQLAAVLGVTPDSGAYKAQIAVPRVFGLIENARGTVSLTSLGMRIIDPQQEKAARVDSFLAVPLYKAIYDKYRGYTLPPAAALEREMANLGVSSKQTGKARQAFERSAKQAGFFWASADRLTLPAIKGAQENSNVPPPPPEQQEQRDFGGGGGKGGGGDNPPPRRLPALIAALIESLPTDGSDWSLDEASDWLQTAAYNFRYAYKLPCILSVTIAPVKVKFDE